MIASKMGMLNKGFLNYMGADWKRAQIAYWRIEHTQFRKDLRLFQERIRVMNRQATAKNRSAVIDIEAKTASEMEKFNHSHSSDRMCSEHGNRSLKIWGVIRGRSDCRLFEDESLFTLTVYAVWSLTNYKLLNCHIMTL
jgi:hypothetical protein